MIKYFIKTLFSFIAMILGIFMFVYGGADDSPGGQLLGLLIFVLGIVVLFKINKKKIFKYYENKSNKN